MTAFLLQNLKLIMLFLLIGSVIGLANPRRLSRNRALKSGVWL
jgi:hypothetical protein